MMISYILVFISGLLVGYVMKVLELTRIIVDLEEKNRKLHQVAMGLLGRSCRRDRDNGQD